jgi:transglutaminase/protease-like cytokinesis protein 3
VEKELFVHDFCLEHFAYDDTFKEHSFSPLGLLVYKTAVCEGISKFVKIVLDYLGVECMLVSGTALGSSDKPPELHMWNIVKINGNTYHLDVTFNMSQKTGVKRYD